MQVTELPYLDEHTTVIAATVDQVWAGLLETLDRAFSRSGAARYARAVGCADVGVAGPRPLDEGSSMPGFEVVTAVPPSLLVLAGRHRFSTYGLTFRIEALGERRSRLRAESRATFPALAGRVYRTLVVGTRGHVVIMRRVLSSVRRAAELAAPASS
jgi:hypothetical protein